MKDWQDMANRFRRDLEQAESGDEVLLKQCRFHFRMWIIAALANFRFESSSDGFVITEPQTGCAWKATLDESNCWKFVCIREQPETIKRSDVAAKFSAIANFH